MREECSRAEGRGVLLPKGNTLRPAASARAEEASHPKTAKNADTWAKIVGRKGKEAARLNAPPREQQPRKQQSVPKGKRKGEAYQLSPLEERLFPSQSPQEVSTCAKTHWPQPEARYASKV